VRNRTMLLSLAVLVAAALGGLFLGVPSAGRAVDEKANPPVGRFQAFGFKDTPITVLDTTNGQVWVQDRDFPDRWHDRGIPSANKK
jgi:hypothetical protein